MIDKYDNSQVEDKGKEADAENPAAEREELTAKLKAWYREDMPHVVKWRKDAREAFEFYNGNQWSEEDLKVLRDQKRPAMVFNRTAPLVNAVVGSEINNRREVQYFPREMGDAKASEILSAAAEWFRDQSEAEDEESEAFQDVVIAGMGWSDTCLDFEEDPDGAPKIVRLDPLKMGWDCNATKPNLQGAERLWYIDEKPLCDVKELFPDNAPEELHAGWAKSLLKDPKDPHDQDSSNMYDGTQSEEDFEANPRKMCTVIECRWLEKETYFRGPAIDPMTGQMTGQLKEYTEEQAKLIQAQMPGFRIVKQTRKVVKRAFLGSVLLGEPDQPPVPPGLFGWECITGYRDQSDGQFYGIVRAVKDPQRWANKFLSQVMFLLNSQSKGGIMAERGAFENDQQAEESWAKTDAITWMKQGSLSGDGPRALPKPTAQFPTGFFALFNESKEAISQVTGLSQEFIGTREVDQAGVLEHQRKQSSLNILASLFNSLRRYRKRQGRVMLHLIQNYLSDGRLIRIAGNDKKQYVPLTKDAITSATYDIIVDDAPTSPNEKERTWGILTQLLPLFKDMLDPQSAMEILEYSPLPASMVEKWKKKMADEAAKKAAEPPKPTPEEMKMQLEQQKAGLAAQGKQQDLAIAQQKGQMDIQMKGIDLMIKQKQAELDAYVAEQKAQSDMRALAIKEQANAIRQQNANTNRGQLA